MKIILYSTPFNILLLIQRCMVDLVIVYLFNVTCDTQADVSEMSLNRENHLITPLTISFGRYRCWHGNTNETLFEMAV